MQKKIMGYSSASTLMFICCLAAACHPVNSQRQGVNLLWLGVQYPNNSIFNIEDIGEGGHALICQTNKRPCCSSPSYRFGEWYYPNGSAVPIKGARAPFYRDRNHEGIVRLNRRNHEADYSTGLFCCVLPDANFSDHTLCAGLLPIGSIEDVSIVGVSYNTTNFSLSCVTSGGIATYINRDDCNSKQQFVSFFQKTLDPLTMRYNNVLKWRSQNQSNYVCSTRNSIAASYAVLLTEFGVGKGSCSSQVIGIQGHKLTLLCLANEPATSVVWTKEGVRYSNNITFAHLSQSDTGKYICRGTVRNQTEVLSVVDLNISRCNAVIYVNGLPAMINITQSYHFSCNTFHWEAGCTEEEYYFYHGNELISRNSTFTFRADSVSGALDNHYFCIVTLNGSNFTSNPSQTPSLIRLPSPLSVNISSDMDNPIPYGSSPMLSCTVSLSPAIDIQVEIIIEWNGNTYGLRQYTTTEPVLNSSAEVPTFTSTATLNASGTFYDSGDYYCSAVINPLSNCDFIQSTSAVDSPRNLVLFLNPHRPQLHSIYQIGHNWIYITWSGNRAEDNVSDYEVKHSYVGECPDVNQGSTKHTVDGTSSSYNITDLRGYYNYSVTLTAINGTGRSPPNTAFAVTHSTAPKGAPQMFTSALVFSTNITVQWQRVRCSERNSEITGYVLQYSLEGSNKFTCIGVSGTNDSNRTYTATRLQPLSRYTFTIAAVNSDGQRGLNVTETVITTSAPESVPFQLQLSGVYECYQWRISDPEDKVHDITIGISSGINERCPHCELEHTNITDGEFQCFPGSPNQVTFRGKVHDRAQATAREVITYIEQWITSSDMVTLPVHHARLNINSTCVVLLSSLDDPECPGYLTPPSQAATTSTTMYTSSTDNTYSSTETVTTQHEMTSPIGGTLNQTISTGSTTQPRKTTNYQVTTSPQLTTGTLNQIETVQIITIDKSHNEEETLSPIDKAQPQSDTVTIIGGAVAIVLIITTGIVIMFILYSVLKYRTLSKKDKKSNIANELGESLHKTAAKPAAASEVEEAESQDDMYEVVEMQVTSSAKTRYAPAAVQTPQESTAGTQPVESEASKDSAVQEENQEAYVNFD